MSKKASPIPIHLVSNTKQAGKIARQLGKSAERWIHNNDFSGEAYSYCLIPDDKGELLAVLAGMNPASPLQALAALPRSLPAGHYALQGEFEDHWRSQAYLGWELAAYQFDRYNGDDKQNSRATLQHADGQSAHIDLQTDATRLVRDLINTPTEDMGPDQLQEETARIGRQYRAKFAVIEGEELEQGFPAIHAVGRASHRAPRLLRLSWGKKTNPGVAVIGKGVCFDTGGLNLKGGSGMRNMKKDMGGAAHALGLAQLVMASKLPVRMELYIAAVENAVSANAYRPGDVVSTRQGINVEIGNTDAEGRVILADALTLACEHQPELMIDFATLTGAARVALGPDLPALFSNDQQLRQELHVCGDEVEDPMWPLPLYQPYMRLLKSDIAHLSNNASSAFGGCITAALFLQQFTNNDIPWCHLDTYGWNEGSRPGRPAGGEAMGLRAAFRLLQNRYAAS